MSKKLQFGLWYSFRNPKEWLVNPYELYAKHIEQIIRCEKLGYNDVWLTEHHFCEDGHAPSILPLAAAVAVKTKTLKIGTGVLLLPLHNAVRVAEDCATIDILSGGRFELGVGIGYRPEEFTALGVDITKRAELIDEGLDVIKQLWSGDAVTYTGRHYQLNNTKLSPLPLQPHGPPLWVGGFAPAAPRRAARLAAGYIGTGDMVEQSKIYLDEWNRLNRREKPRMAGGHFWLVVSKNPDQTYKEIAPHVLYQIKVYNEWLSSAGQALFPEISDAHQLKELGILNCVSPQQACDLIGEYAEETGIERYYTWTVPPGYAVDRMNECLEIFAEQVIPHFQ